MKSLKLANATVHALFPSRVAQDSATYLDVITLYQRLMCRSYSASENGASDHKPVIAEVAAFCDHKVTPIQRWLFNNVDLANLGHYLRAIDLRGCSSVDEASLYWLHEFNNTLDVLVPIKQLPFKKNKTYIDKDTRQLVKKRDFLAKNISSTSSPYEFEQLKIARRQVKSRIRRSKKEHAAHAFSSNSNKTTWRFIREATFTGGKSSTSHICPDTLNSFFGELVSSPNEGLLNQPQGCEIAEAFTIQPVSITTVRLSMD